MAGVTARFSTYDSAMLLVVLGSLNALVAIISLEVLSPVAQSSVEEATKIQQAQ